MSQYLPEKLDLTRQSVDRTVEQIEACFTAENAVSDQLLGACDLLLDFTKQFGVKHSHRDEAIMHKSSAQELLARERRGEIDSNSFRAESAQLRRRVLELKTAVAEEAIKHIGAISELPTAVVNPVSLPASANIPPSDLRSSLERFLKNEAGEGIVFRSTGLGKRYGLGGPFVIQDLDITLTNGEITGVIGLNGSGKTTLLRMVAGSLEPTCGKREYPELKCAPDSWTTIRRSIAFVAQRPDRWSGTVEDALMLQAACFGDTGKAGLRLVDFYLARLGLMPYRHHTWAQLSGGYRTRFELAKAMLSHPKMLVLDEPLAALDIPAQMQFLSDLENFATVFAKPMPVLISSQHIYEVEAIAKRMIVIRDGRAVYSGTTAALGGSRKINGFELSCSASATDLATALVTCGVQAIHKLGPNEYFVTTSVSADARQMLDALQRANVSVRHFRDASRSSRMFFES